MEAVLSPPRWPEKPRNLAPSFVLALAMHALLFVGFSIAVQWRTEPQAEAVAELWGALPPVEVAPPPQPRPAPEPPRVEPAPQPAPTEAEIALEQERKRREQERLEAERRRLEEERQKRELEKRRAEEDARRKQEAEARRKAEEEKRLAAEREAFRQAMEQRMAAQVEPRAGAPGAGALRGGTDASYAAAVVACIRPHIAFAVPEGTPASVAAEFRVELLPDASVAAVTLLKPSGLPGYDAAAERAIRRCDPFPRKRDGTIDRTILVTLRPVETR
jgi:colicin import membrane protein